MITGGFYEARHVDKGDDFESNDMSYDKAVLKPANTMIYETCCLSNSKVTTF